MRKRDLRVGLHIKFIGTDKKTGRRWEEHGVTNSRNGRLIMDCFSVYGGEGYTDLDEYIALGGKMSVIKLVDRVYDPHER
jgi:hypothetical protein